MARIDASVAGGFDQLKLPGSLESYVSTRLAAYGQVLAVHVSTVLFSSRYTATVAFQPNTQLTTDQVRTLIADVFQDWNGVAANVTITSAGEAPQTGVPSVFDGLGQAAGTVETILILGAIVFALSIVRDATK